MPARSEAQRRYLFAHFGADWVRRHHFDNPGRLPARAPGRRHRRHPHRQQAIERLLKSGR